MLLVRRSRWLMLSIVLLFSFSTPGQHLSGWPGSLGVTLEGLAQAWEHVARLVLLLVTLAIVHEWLGTAGLMTSLYWWLGPLSRWKNLRERIVVRLMLVLEHAETKVARSWKEWLQIDVEQGPSELSLEVPRLGRLDLLAAGLLVLGWIWVGR